MSGVQTVWGWPIAIYLFLAGVAAGAYLSAAYVWYKRGDNPVSRMGIFLAAPCLGVSILFLFFDLGAPLRFMLAFLKPFSSMISVGTWVLTIFFIIAALQWLKCYKAKEASLELSNAAWIAGIIFAVATAVYTGVLLGVVKAIPFWNTPLLPVLFFISSVSTGIGALLVGVLIKGAKDSDVGILHSLSRIDLVFVGLEVLVLLFYLLVMGQSRLAAASSVKMLVAGSCAPFFWIFVVVGLLVPFCLEWGLNRKQDNQLSSMVVSGTAAGICLLFGGLALRYLILAVGIFEGFSPIL
ncbi:MAG TPA: polysulfide reductase NrfD [Syntrophomonadaceae bacterium]|jgi:formate-dependent nitrite reductase membrane component NrfD|nr:polysulfide reductase NrfD [Syntrophomonadaceae bacterium]